MLRYKSTSCLNDYGQQQNLKNLQERYDSLQEKHRQLKLETNVANDEIKKLHTKLSRLLSEKKSLLKNIRTEHEIMLEERIFDMSNELWQQQQQNERLREQLKLMHYSNDNSRPKSSNQKPTRSTSALYSNIRSRTDSGLGFYFRPLNLSNCKTTRRSRSQNDRQVTFEDKNDQNQNTTTNELQQAINLIQEAKAEIIRLESIIEKQKQIIDQLQNGQNPDDTMLSTMMIIMNKTTTATRSTNLNTHDYDDDQTELWSKYQQLIQNKQSNEQWIECRKLFEQFYQTICSERKKSNEYSIELQKQQKQLLYNRLLMEKNSALMNDKLKLIETLRKENLLLQNSLKQLMEQSSLIQNNNNNNNNNGIVDYQKQQQLLTIQLKNFWQQKRQQYDEQIIELNEKIQQLNAVIEQKQQQNDQLMIRYENLKQLNDNDQLKILHLERKIDRLTQILFNNIDDNDDDDDDKTKILNGSSS